MNTPNPLVPQGALDRHSKGKSTVRIAIFTIVFIHAVFFAGLLMQGCRRDEGKSAAQAGDTLTNENMLPPLDAGYYSSTQESPQPAAMTAPANVAASPVNETASSLPPAAAVEPPVEGKPYTIVRGDTLAKIAKANGISLTALSQANPDINPARLRPGQQIQVPAPATAPSSGLGFKEPEAGTTAAASGTVYKVKPGDTLIRIAKRHGTTVKAIRAANGLKSDRLTIGQKLTIAGREANSGGGESAKPTTVSKLTAADPAAAGPGSEALGRSGVR